MQRRKPARKKKATSESTRSEGTVSVPVKLKGLFLRFSGYSVLAGATNISEERLKEIMNDEQWTPDEEEKINHLYYQVYDFG